MRVVQKKICLLGDFAVGKSSLIRRFVEGRFDDKYLSTIGVKISRKPVELPSGLMNLLIWDLAGGDEFKDSQANYLRGVAGALIVCDLTRYETLGAFERYAHQVHGVNPEAPLFFVGNKVDLVEERMISDEELMTACLPLGGHYLTSSAKTGVHVEDSFYQLASQLV